MKLAKGADVFTRAGDKVGKLERVILEPDTKTVTHVVVEKEFLFTSDRVIPIEQIDAYGEKGIRLNGSQGDFESFPVFEETHYVMADDEERPASESTIGGAYWYPPADLAWWRAGAAYGGYYAAMPGYVLRTNQNIPEGTVALEEGARVTSKDGKHVGSIEQVVVEPEDNRATHFVVKEGVLFTDKKLIPVTWISRIDENDVKLSVGAAVLECLPEYRVHER